ncbi:hypothetical protein KNP414_01007 [Paenibacillus mucilaginosus KNP414]|uniref:Uncharacterized protein n=1 Tax=Paenibacillus mucilaginosus (strain KNP414) TaxID=1036673 RepID=F8FAE4_PAEMK|nr:hypothetical protein KNP414_01007 [Paenibacillus mucilaginosus KNP414]
MPEEAEPGACSSQADSGIGLIQERGVCSVDEFLIKNDPT